MMEKIYKEVMAETSLDMVKTINLRIQNLHEPKA